MKQLNLFFIILILVTSTFVYGQKIQNIQFKQLKLSYLPVGFFVHSIIDNRDDSSKIAIITEKNGEKTVINFQNNASSSISTFIKNNLEQNTHSIPITLKITKLNVQVKKIKELYNVEILMGLGFYFEDKKLMELTGKGQTSMTADVADYLESFIRETLDNDLKAFGDWYNKNRDKIATDSIVKVNIIIGKTPDKKGQIIYNPQKQLVISDFEGQPDNLVSMLATTFSGVGFSYSSAIENSRVVVNLTITTYFEKLKSWFKEEGKTPSLLAHEQLHFDIRALQACLLIKTIMGTTFTKNNYIQLLEQKRMENAEQGGEQQELYDKETNHGIIAEQQEVWYKKIKQKMKDLGCF